MSQDEILDFFSNLIKKEIGIVYAKHNINMLKARLVALCKQFDLESLEDFYNYFILVNNRKSDPSLKLIILDAATNNETQFFRDKDTFDALNTLFIKHAKEHPFQHFDIWCCACSTGQEPYSIAIMFDNLKRSGINFTYSILATDISSLALHKAKQGIYSQIQIQRGLLAQEIIQYFEQNTNERFPSWKIKPELQKNIEFRQINLTKDWFLSKKFDFILCRNVLIYHTIEKKIDILDRIFEQLNPGGYLILGGTESIIGLSDKYSYENFHKTVFFGK